MEMYHTQITDNPKINMAERDDSGTASEPFFIQTLDNNIEGERLWR